MIQILVTASCETQTSSLTKWHHNTVLYQFQYLKHKSLAWPHVIMVSLVAVPVPDTQTYISTYCHRDTECITDVSVTNVSLSYSLCTSFVQNITQDHTIRIQLWNSLNTSGQHIHTVHINTQRSQGYEILCDAFLCQLYNSAGTTVQFHHYSLLLIWKAGFFSDPFPDQACPMSSPCPLKNTNDRTRTPRAVISMPAVAGSSGSSGSAGSSSDEINELRPPANRTSCNQQLFIHWINTSVSKSNLQIPLSSILSWEADSLSAGQ